MSTEVVSRRTSHVCSIKDCQNLLAPGIPWKMCGMCRERDRENRKNKKLREINKLPPLRNRIPSAIPKRRKKKDQATDTATASSSFSTEAISKSISMMASSSTDPLDQTGESSFEFVNADQSTLEVIWLSCVTKSIFFMLTNALHRFMSHLHQIMMKLQQSNL